MLRSIFIFLVFRCITVLIETSSNSGKVPHCQLHLVLGSTPFASEFTWYWLLTSRHTTLRSIFVFLVLCCDTVLAESKSTSEKVPECQIHLVIGLAPFNSEFTWYWLLTSRHTIPRSIFVFLVLCRDTVLAESKSILVKIRSPATLINLFFQQVASWLMFRCE
jgi:hypothetical protein